MDSHLSSIAICQKRNDKGYQNRAGGARYRGHFNGIMDEVMIFDRALSDSEIKMIYNSQK